MIIQVVNCYLVQAGVTGSYAVAGHAGQTFTSSGNELVTFDDGVVYGDAALFNAANDTLSPPSSAALVRLVAGGEIFNWFHSEKNGAIHAGWLGLPFRFGVWNSCAGAILSGVSPSDAFRIVHEDAGPGYTSTAIGWFAIEKLDPATDYTLVTKTANTGLTGAGWTFIPWNNEITDTLGFHDNSTNNTRFTVPSGVSFLRLSCGIEATIGGNIWAWLASFKGGGTTNFAGMLSMNRDAGQGASRLGAHSCIVPVSAGNFFEIAGLAENTSVVVAGGADTNSWAQVEVFPSDYRFCAVYKTATQAITGGVYTVVLFGGEISDTEGCHSTSSNTGQIVIPANVSECRVSFNVQMNSTNVECLGYGRLTRGGVVPGIGEDGMPMAGCGGTPTGAMNAIGAWVACSPGDIVELLVNPLTAGQTMQASESSWLCVEFR